MALKAKHPKKAKPRKPKFLVFGPAGVGKTWCALDWPACYYIDTEGGASLPQYTDKLEKSGGVYLGPEDGANDFAVVLDQVMSLATTKHPYRTLVIDSFSKVFGTAIANELTRMEQKGQDLTKTFSAEKKKAIGKTKQLIAWFDRLDMNVLIICHQKALWKDSEQIGETFDGWDKLDYELDLAIQVIKQGQSRKAKIGKCRLEQFREGEVLEWSYRAFAERYGLDVIESEVSAAEPASSEQIRVVGELAELVKLEDEARIKWFDKAGVDSWGQMDFNTIQACIDYLTAKLPKAPAVA
jgi:hypothetical protein